MPTQHTNTRVMVSDLHEVTDTNGLEVRQLQTCQVSWMSQVRFLLLELLEPPPHLLSLIAIEFGQWAQIRPSSCLAHQRLFPQICRQSRRRIDMIMSRLEVSFTLRARGDKSTVIATRLQPDWEVQRSVQPEQMHSTDDAGKISRQTRSNHPQ